MIILIRGCTILPQSPKDSQTSISQAAVGMTFRFTMGSDTRVIHIHPERMARRDPGPLLDDVPDIMVTGFAKLNPFVFTTADCDWTSSCQGLNTAGRRETVPVVPKFGQ